MSDDRIDQIIELVSRLAAGDLTARQEPSDSDDELDAILVGINMLAEDLQSSRQELEDRVQARTVALQQLHSELLQLTELGNLLQACETRKEVYAVLSRGVPLILAGLHGSVYLYNASRNLLENTVTWGDQPPPLMSPDACWALRRGTSHGLSPTTLSVACHHVAPGIEEALCVPMTARGITIGLLHLTTGERTEARSAGLVAAHQQMATAVATQIGLCLTNLELRETLRTQALRDPLTGLYNRRFLEDWIERETNRTSSAGTSLGVMVADVDHFKQVNDLQGHDAGDDILRGVGEVLRSRLRTGDLACRYGGEEFLIIVPDIDLDGLVARAELVREQVSLLRVDHDGVPVPAVTISIGIALYPQHGASPVAVISAADAALYAAKRSGRNRVVAAPRSLEVAEDLAHH